MARALAPSASKRCAPHLGCVHDLIRQALSNRLDVAERRLARARGDQVDGLVDAANRRHIARLPPHCTAAANTCGVLTWTAVDDSLDVDLDWVLLCQQVDNLESVLHNAQRHDLLAVVAAVAHHGADHALHNRALCLAETLLLPAALRVRQKLRILWPARDVVLERHVLDLHILKRPPAEELDLAGKDRHA